MAKLPASRWVERALTLLALAAIWPWLLDWPHPFWRGLAWTMLAAMALLFVLNVIRLWRMGHPES
jgi:hypothetical protein